jgi:hypothetical protein
MAPTKQNMDNIRKRVYERFHIKEKKNTQSIIRRARNTIDSWEGPHLPTT